MVQIQRFRFLITGVTVFLVVGCLGPLPRSDAIPVPPSPATIPFLPQGPALRVLVLGDWGTGGAGQREVAQAIAATHEDSPPHLVLSVGDNFYEAGVRSPGEPRVKLLFEYVYAGPFWEDLPFYATLGNHDHWGRPAAQVEYSARNNQWILPALHYAFHRPLSNGDSVLFLALDTDPVTERRPGAKAQLEWADSILSTPTQGWVLAFGHHPFISGGWHSVRGSFSKAMVSLLAGRSHVYVAGHNHSTELIQSESGLPQLVCGGAGGLDNAYRVRAVEGTLAAYTNGGWCLLHIQPEVMAIELYDRAGGLQYRHLLERTPVR